MHRFTIFIAVALLSFSMLPSAQSQEAGITAQRSFQTSLENGFIPDEEITVQVAVSNGSQDTTVTETVPDGFSIVSAEGGTINEQVITWTVSASEEKTELSYRAKAPADFTDPTLPRLFVWEGKVGTTTIAGSTQLNLIYQEQEGVFDYHADIGDVDANGYVSYDDQYGEYEIEGSGYDIWNTNDEFQFIFNEISGNFRIHAHVILAPQNQTWSMAGIMIRDNLSVGSTHASARIRRDGADYQSAWRDTQDGSSGEASEGLVPGIDNTSSTPEQEGVIEMERMGNTVSYYYYDLDGNRILHTTKTISGGLTDPVYVGLFLTSHNDGDVGYGIIGDVSVEKIETTAQRSFQTSLENGFVPEEEFSVQLAISNEMGISQDITVTDTVPDGFTVVSADGGKISGQTITWTPSVPAGGTTLSYQVKAPSDFIDPNTPRLFVWKGKVGNTTIAGITQLNLVHKEQAGLFEYHADIGDVDTPGSVSYEENSGEYTVEGSGADIWNTNDEFQFVFNEMSGSFRIRAHVISAPQNHMWSMTGLMIRDNLSTGSTHTAARIRRDGADYQSAWRDTQNGSSGESSDGLVPGIENTSSTPEQEGVIELERIGDTVSYYYYDLEGNRILHTTKTITGGLTDPVYAGLFTTSHVDGEIGESIISDTAVETIALNTNAQRSLTGERIKPEQDLKGITITANVRSGNPTITETIPEGWTLLNQSADKGTAAAKENTIEWDLSGVTGTATLVYDLRPLTPETKKAWFSGTVKEGNDEREIAGISVTFYRDGYELNAPYLEKSIVLDGKIGADEWDGATTYTYDREETDPQEHLVFGVNKPFDESHTTIHVFHNEDSIFLGIDVLDLDINSDLTNVYESDSAEVSWNGNFSRSDTFLSNRESFQSIVTADGDRAIGQFVPTIEALDSGRAYHSTDGEVWNFGGALKEDGTGYVTEYAVKKSEILDPIDIQTIGWSVSTNDAIANQTRESRYAMHMADPDTGLTVESWNIPRNWGILHLLTGATSVKEWPLY